MEKKYTNKQRGDGSNKSQYGKEFANSFFVMKCFYLLLLLLKFKQATKLKGTGCYPRQPYMQL